jgi:hypothetical protein
VTKVPTNRATKWLNDIPVEATCSACPGVSFRAQGSGHLPNREEYHRSFTVSTYIARPNTAKRSTGTELP